MARPRPDLAFVYPPGPYGRSVGEVLEDLVVDGYPLEPGVSMTGTPMQPVRLSRYLARNSCYCVLIVQDAFYLRQSRELMRTLSREAGKRGLCVFDVLEQGTVEGTRATGEDVTTWAYEFGPEFPVVRGGPVTASTLPELYGFPSLTTVRVPSMRIALHRVGLQNKPIDDALGVCPTN